jgi:hypothetical protein
MDAIDWKRVQFFKESESWGDPQKIHPILVYTLDGLRAYLNRRIYITSGTQGVHAPDSQHYRGLAVDAIIDIDDVPKIDIAIDVLRFPFTGIGFYPKWKHPNVINGLGIHLDFRQANHKSIWIGFSEKDGRTIQYGMNKANLYAFGFMG